MGKARFKYAIESCYLGPHPPWSGWKTTRFFATSDDRDVALKLLRLQAAAQRTLWDYRAADRS